MKIFKKQYRIIRDNYKGYEVQKRTYYWPFWWQISEKGFSTNTHGTIEEAEQLIKIDKTKEKAVKTFHWE